ncbi:MAG: hypothetical protein ACI4NA_01305 [Succinivibrio sp.]
MHFGSIESILQFMALYPKVAGKAVRLGCGLTAGCLFIDGSKRIRTHAMLVMLDISGIALQYWDEGLIGFFMKAAAGKADDRVPAHRFLPAWHD